MSHRIHQATLNLKTPTATEPTEQTTSASDLETTPLNRVRAGADAHAAALEQATGGQLGRAGPVLLQLQRDYGNRYVQQVASLARGSGSTLQPKLVVTPPGDRYEQEADQVAASVVDQVAQPRQEVRHQGPQADEAQVKRKPVAQALEGASGMAMAPELEAAVNQARGGGRSLPTSVRAPMEQAMGVNFGGVKVHTDTGADELNRTIQARAFTTGQDIFFRRGEYAPGSQSGQSLLAHELTHVVQQNQGTTEALQAFWVREGGKDPYWEGDETKKKYYTKTEETYWNKWHWSSTPVYIPSWTKKLSVRGIADFGSKQKKASEEREKEQEGKVYKDLKKIQATQTGANLLKAVGVKARHDTLIEAMEFHELTGPTTTASGHGRSDPSIGAPSTIQLGAGLPFDMSEIGIEGEATWNPTASDIVLYHELVHAYHNQKGTVAEGRLTEDQAIHEGDIGVALTEYQATGLNTADGDERYQFAKNEKFSENIYRRQRGNTPVRDAYQPKKKKEEVKSGFSLKKIFSFS
jgi:hypothetical protein